MSDLFPDRPIAGILKERFLVVARRYVGSTDLATDRANALAELDKIFNPDWFDLECDTADQTVYEIQDEGGSVAFVDTYGAIEDCISPVVYRQTGGVGNFEIVDETEYTLNRANGEITFGTSQGVSDVITASICGNIPGATSIEMAGKTNLSSNKLLVLGQTSPAFSWIVDEGTDHTFSFDASLHVGKRNNVYPGMYAEKMIYGSDWTESAAGASGTDFSDNATINKMRSNEENFFVAWIYIATETTAGTVKAQGELAIGCKLDEIPATKNLNTGNDPAMKTFKGNATALYSLGLLNA
jgi:hypothetical protein